MEREMTSEQKALALGYTSEFFCRKRVKLQKIIYKICSIGRNKCSASNHTVL